jgi:triacylglycerol lipase
VAWLLLVIQGEVTRAPSSRRGDMSTKREFVEVFLVPGFLGFQQLVELPYFLGVKDVLGKKLEGRGLDAEIHALGTKVPAGSLRIRTAYLAKDVAALHSSDAKSVHFVGHSTGGLDIRLLLSPGTSIESGEDLRSGGVLEEGDELDEAEIQNLRDALDKTRSAISVATPHLGTPIADAAMRVAFDRILQGTHHMLESPVAVKLFTTGLTIAGGASTMLKPFLFKGSFLRWIVTKVLSKSPEALLEYLQRAGADVGALRNLTQEGMDVADALLIDRPGVRYGSIITGTRKPGYVVHTRDALLLTATLFYWVAWLLASRKNPNYPYTEQFQELLSCYEADRRDDLPVGELSIDEHTSDGVVPTLSQAYGTILGVFASDHLDCVGHFPHKQGDDDVPGWVRSGANFDPKRFDLLWGRVGNFVADYLPLPVTDEASHSPDQPTA